jgi:hypothetical protein
MLPISKKIVEYERELLGDESRAHTLAVVHILAGQICEQARLAAGAFDGMMILPLLVIQSHCERIHEYTHQELQAVTRGMAIPTIERTLALMDDVNPEDRQAADELIHRAAQDFHSKASDG